MKRIYASLGLATIGVASVQIAHGQSVDPSKSWSVSAALRGFYDDNINTGDSKNAVESPGFEVSPSLSFNLPLEQTSIAASYTYSYKWYDEVVNYNKGHDRQTHNFGIQLRHAFSERFLVSVQDSFVVGQEPDVLRVGNEAGLTYAVPGDNIRNYGSIVFGAQISRPFGIEIGYANSLYDYEDDEDYGLSARLDRLVHVGHLNGRWIIQPNTVGIVGYQCSYLDYTADLPVGGIPPFTIYSSERNSLSHYGYVGLEHTFRPDLVGDIKGGVRYSDYVNDPFGQTDLAPYGEGSLRWTYAKESSLDVGVSYDQNATDQFSTGSDSITLSADSVVAYLALTHRILPSLFGTVMGSYQYSTFNGGDLDGKKQQYFAGGVNLEYRFNRHLSANVGYNYDNLDSDSGVQRGSYDRNRVYGGVTIIY